MPPSILQKHRLSVKLEKHPHGRGIHAVMMEHIMLLQEKIQGYVFEVVYNRLGDSNCLLSDQEEISVLLCDRNFLEKVDRKPQIGCNGTFSTICNTWNRSVHFDENTLVEKDTYSGQIVTSCEKLQAEKQFWPGRYSSDAF